MNPNNEYYKKIPNYSNKLTKLVPIYQTHSKNKLKYILPSIVSDTKSLIEKQIESQE